MNKILKKLATLIPLMIITFVLPTNTQQRVDISVQESGNIIINPKTKNTHFNTANQILRYLQYFEKKRFIYELERTDDPKIVSNYSSIKKDFERQSPPSKNLETMFKKDYDFYTTKRQLQELIKTGDPRICPNRYNFLLSKWEEIKNHEPLIPEHKWKRAYSRYKKLEREQTGDPQIFHSHKNIMVSGQIILKKK